MCKNIIIRFLRHILEAQEEGGGGGGMGWLATPLRLFHIPIHLTVLVDISLG